MNQPNINEMLQQLMNNPMQMLARSGFKISGNTNDPVSIIQQLLNSGQVSQQQLNQAQAMAANITKNNR